jgi:hypothetical protein
LAEGGRRESDEACKSREEKSWKTHREKDAGGSIVSRISGRPFG